VTDNDRCSDECLAPGTPQCEKFGVTSVVEKPQPQRRFSTGGIERARRSPKELLVSELLCRWWYVLPDWPPTDYTEELKRRHLRVVEIKDWERVPERDKLGRTKVYELSQFRGLFRDPSGELVDLRPQETCPCFVNFIQKDEVELRGLLVKAFEKQLEALRSHGSGEKELEKDLMRRLAARRKEIRMARKASSQSFGVADGSFEEVQGVPKIVSRPEEEKEKEEETEEEDEEESGAEPADVFTATPVVTVERTGPACTARTFEAAMLELVCGALDATTLAVSCRKMLTTMAPYVLTIPQQRRHPHQARVAGWVKDALSKELTRCHAAAEVVLEQRADTGETPETCGGAAQATRPTVDLLRDAMRRAKENGELQAILAEAKAEPKRARGTRFEQLVTAQLSHSSAASLAAALLASHRTSKRPCFRSLLENAALEQVERRLLQQEDGRCRERSHPDERCTLFQWSLACFEMLGDCTSSRCGSSTSVRRG